MKYQTFINIVDKKHQSFKYFKKALSIDKPLTDLTLTMPFNEYNELLHDCMNKPNFVLSASPTVGIIKHFTVNGISVHIVEGNEVEWGLGKPKADQKFFETLSFESLTHQNKPESLFPSDAYDFEVFHIKENTAFLGFKIGNGDFHFVQVPYNPGKHQAKVIQMQTLPHRA